MKLPQGWKEVELGDVLDYEQPTDYIVANEDYADEYETPVLTAGKSFILGYTDEKKGIYNKLPVIIFDDFTVASKYVTFPFKVKSSAMKLLTPKTKDVNLKYIFWLMQTIKVNSVSHKRYYLSKYQHIKIPLPPLPIQQKIVSILEKAEKAKEWRKEADELTKDFLKSVFIEMFGGPILNNMKWDSKELEYLCEKVTDGEHLNPQLQKEGKHLIMAKDVLENNVDFSQNNFVSEENFQKYVKKCKPEQGDLLLVSRGATIGRCTSVKTTIPFCLMGSVILIKPKNINVKFLEYLFRDSNFIKKVVNVSGASAQQAIYLINLKKLVVLSPHLPLQQKFASIVKEVEAMKEQQKQSKEQIGNLFNALMQKAFKGELI